MIGLGLQSRDIANTLCVYFRSTRDHEKVDADTGGIETHCLQDRIFDCQAETRVRQFLPIDIRSIGAEYQAGLLAANNVLEMVGLSDRQLNCVGAGVHQRANDFAHIFDAGEKSRLVEEAVIDGNIEAALRAGVEEAIQAGLFHQY